eukprot:scaffold20798_cov42-Phaeocystis_antarctica.AAC.1
MAVYSGRTAERTWVRGRGFGLRVGVGVAVRVRVGGWAGERTLSQRSYESSATGGGLAASTPEPEPVEPTECERLLLGTRGGDSDEAGEGGEARPLVGE